jgi:DnaJ-class molecular chaperone
VDAPTLAAAFRRTVLACHPDTAPPGAAPDFARRFRLAMDAWEVLREPAKRKRYDERGTA